MTVALFPASGQDRVSAGDDCPASRLEGSRARSSVSYSIEPEAPPAKAPSSSSPGPKDFDVLTRDRSCDVAEPINFGVLHGHRGAAAAAR